MIKNTEDARIYNDKNAFNVIVNLHLIYKVYRLMSNTKADIFKKYDFYEDVLHITRQRFYRICRGQNFQLTKEEKKSLAELFHISESYFIAGGEWIGLHNISESDWRCYFQLNQYMKDLEQNIPSALKYQMSNKVTAVLEETIKNKLIESTYDVNEPLYHVYYYFKHGVPYTEETQLAKFTRELAKMKITDWDDLLKNETELMRYGEMLEKHHKYIQSVLTYLNLRKE